MPTNTTASVLSRRKLREFCTKYRIRRLAKLPRGSDRRIRILAEFEPRARVGFFDLISAENELSDLLGGKISIITPGAFPNGARQDLLRDAQELFPAAT
jgi:predicted nucleotidyltransferase